MSCPPRTGTTLPPIVFAIDEGYLEACCVALLSISDATPDPSRLEVFILHRALTADSLRRLDANAHGLRLCHRRVDTVHSSWPLLGRMTDAVYLRLAVGESLAEHSQALYLDADVVVRSDIVRLLLTDLAGSTLAAVRDPLNPVLRIGRALPGWEDLGLHADQSYFNSGVMMLNLLKCRERRVFERSIAFLLERSQNVSLWDQDALNWVVKDDWLRLDRRWNAPPMSALMAMPTESYDAEAIVPLGDLIDDEVGAWIVHFIGARKPWSGSFPPCPAARQHAELRRRLVA